MNRTTDCHKKSDSRDQQYRIRQADKRRTENLKRQIEDARKKKERLLFLLLFILLHCRMFWIWQPVYWPKYRVKQTLTPERSRVDKLKKIWEPNPSEDFAPEPGTLEYCDGYSLEGWQQLAEKNGRNRSKKGVLIGLWKDDPMRYRYPQRYQDWYLRPNLPQLMVEIREPYWRVDALAAIKLQTPPEVHSYLDEAFALDPADIRQCYSEHTVDVIANFRSAALQWEIRKEREAVERHQRLDFDNQMQRPER
ncbi:hypothetical protein ACCT14_13475 [Rhizobium brockwellii]|uniref:hypothetical protein n=1 Tax=Rhizobium brockwellii TaxID=3019932 RepID=UPI003F96E0B3